MTGINAPPIRKGKNRTPPKFGYSVELLVAVGTAAFAAVLGTLKLMPLDWLTGVTGAVLVLVLFVAYKSNEYSRVMAETVFSLDDYMQDKPSLVDRVYIALSHDISSGSKAKSDPIELTAEPSPYIEGLQLSRARKDKSQPPLDLSDSTPEKQIIVGSIRMGFGHHRIAQAASTWGVGKGINTVFHDLLAIESREADLITSMDKMYSMGSRLASELGGPVEKAWGHLTMSAGENALRQSWLMGEALTALMETMPKDTPVIASHPLVGMVAVSCGFKNVINCVIDNYAQWFCVVPGAINIVQGPANFSNLLKMGMPAKEVRMGGAWVPKHLVDNIEEDTQRRLDRVKSGAPRRFLVPIGGAGAQRQFVEQLVTDISKPIKENKAQLFLNSGDRPANQKAFAKLLDKLELEYERVTSFDRLKEMIADDTTVKTPVVLLTFEEYFPAMCCTDMLMRICDVMAVKPSELAFYPIPKIMIRRVGDHEQWSAWRAAEIGDGTAEVRTNKEAKLWIRLMTEGPELFTEMCNNVLNNHSIGLYNGSKIAVEMAQKMARGEEV